MTRDRLGFIGIGIMGEAAVRRLLDLGRSVSVWNREPERLDLVTRHGAVAAESPAEVLREADTVILCVLDGAAVRECVTGPRGLLAGGRADGKLFIDLSTIDPDVTREIAAVVGDAGAAWVDAPVSGGPAAARTGQLTIMAGGEAADFERAGPVLADLGANVTRMGEVGAGQTTKVINQAIVGAGYVLMAEALRLAEAAGVDAARLPACLAGGLADSALLRTLYPRMQRREFDPPTAYARQLLKDLKAVQDFAARCGCDLPVVGQARQQYQRFVDSGNAMRESASIVELYEAGDPGVSSEQGGAEAS